MRTLAIASGKGGVGVTTLTIALGAALTELGVDTAVVDANITNPCVGLHLGTPNVPVALHDTFDDPAKLDNALYHHVPSGLKVVLGHLSVVHAKRHKHHELLKLPQILKRLPCTLAVLDCATGHHAESLAALAVVDEALIVTTPELPSVINSLKLIARCKEFGTPVKGVIINRAGSHDHELTADNVQSLLETPVLAVVPEDPSISEALAIKHPVTYSHPDSPASQAVKQLASSLL
ncbi:P-loop NTPase [Candidatus Woesearchaeota archaeon]|nr:P-loop NTPase [Candidatus Woesearchaeota archaeon]